MKPTTTRDFTFVYPLLLGAIAFLLVVGIGPLNPTNVGWILGRLDPTKDYLGWVFYRNSDWYFPVGLNPSFGLDIASSIVYSDSIPLLAISFKSISTLLPPGFHYFGLWIFVCFLLQSWFAWKIVCLFTQSVSLRLLACGLFLFSPSMLWRLNTPAGGHAALVGHFLILWAIYLVLRPSQNRRTLYWILLLSLSVLIHFYLFAIVTFLWLTDLCNRYFAHKNLSPILAIQEAFLAFVCVLFFAWQAGYFSIAASLNNDRGYGFDGMNVLGPIDPQGWSYIMNNFTHPSSWGEGFSYMGLGVIASGIFALIGLLKQPLWTKKLISRLTGEYPFIGLLMIGLIAFAISHHISIGNSVYTFTLPTQLISLADIIRSSARMFWPVNYLLIIVFLIVIARCYPDKSALTIIALCTSLQVIDTSSGWLRNREQLAVDRSSELNPQNLSNPFWKAAGSHYKKLVLIPVMDMSPNWEKFALFSANHHMQTNAVHMARIDLVKQEMANQKLNQQVNTGKFNSDSLYAIENRFVIAALATSPNSTTIAKIDTINIVAPNWKDCKTCPPIDPTLILARDRYATNLNEIISFSSNSPNRSYYLRSGWSWSESWGTWSDSKNAVLNLSWPTNPPNSLELTFNTFLVPVKHPSQEVDVLVNGELYQHLHLTQLEGNRLKITLTPQMKAAKYLTIEFVITNPIMPADLSINVPDKRKLGIGMVSAIFR